jgi:hypothetical protein
MGLRTIIPASALSWTIMCVKVHDGATQPQATKGEGGLAPFEVGAYTELLSKYGVRGEPKQTDEKLWHVLYDAQREKALTAAIAKGVDGSVSVRIIRDEKNKVVGADVAVNPLDPTLRRPIRRFASACLKIDEQDIGVGDGLYGRSTLVRSMIREEFHGPRGGIGLIKVMEAVQKEVDKEKLRIARQVRKEDPIVVETEEVAVAAKDKSAAYKGADVKWKVVIAVDTDFSKTDEEKYLILDFTLAVSFRPSSQPNGKWQVVRIPSSVLDSDGEAATGVLSAAGRLEKNVLNRVLKPKAK